MLPPCLSLSLVSLDISDQPLNMTPLPEKFLSQTLRSRGVGARVGTLIGAGWMVSGLSGLSLFPAVLLGSVGLAAVLWLLISANQLIGAARKLPTPDAAAKEAHRRARRLFWINLAVEIALINAAIFLLSSPELHRYWVPAISLAVGLHFLPLASISSVPSYWTCGLAMMGVAAIVAVVLALDLSSPQLSIAAEAIVNAVVLWSTAAWGILTNARLTARSSEPALRSGR